MESTEQSKIFISYAWGGESGKTKDDLVNAFSARGVVVLHDTTAVGYRDSIGQFMKLLGQGRFIILVISKKYLEAPNCMFELVEIAKNKEFRDRIYPIVLQDAGIYNPLNQVGYLRYWEEKIKELEAAIREAGGLDHMGGVFKKLDLYREIRTQISSLLETLSDMNNLSPELLQGDGYKIVFEAIMSKIASEALPINGNQQDHSAIIKDTQKLISNAKFEQAILDLEIYINDKADQLSPAITTLKSTFIDNKNRNMMGAVSRNEYTAINNDLILKTFNILKALKEPNI